MRNEMNRTTYMIADTSVLAASQPHCHQTRFWGGWMVATCKAAQHCHIVSFLSSSMVPYHTLEIWDPRVLWSTMDLNNAAAPG